MRCLMQRGFTMLPPRRWTPPFHLPAVRDYLDFVRASASPIQQILDSLSQQATDAAWAAIKERLDVFTTPDGWVGPNELLLTTARR